MRAAAREPTGQQREAVRARDTDVFLQAGAGTGKTGVLVDRYCAAICEDGASPDRILAFTFTERAAAELRRRIRRELERLAAETADRALAARLGEAVRGLGAAWITTIHGFCRRLLASHPVAAGLDPRFRVLDEAEARRVALVGFDAALEDLVGAGDAEREGVLALYSVRRARELVLAAHAELRSRGVAARLPAVTPRDLEPALAELEAAGAAAAGASGGSPDQDACFERARRLAAGRAGGAPTYPELEALELESGSQVPERRRCLEAIRLAAAVAAEHEQGRRAYEVLDHLLQLFAGRYEEGKSQRSGLDFEDLQLRAVALLRDSAGIGGAYRERFLHLLVDEFQDTNALQLSLIEQLRGPGGRLFVVGDEFQAIYGFRHADIDVFTGERQRFAERSGAEVASLTGNFRSRPEIVATANALGTATMAGFRPLSCGREVAPGDPGEAMVELLVTEAGEWAAEATGLERRKGDPTPAESVAEARNLARHLRGLADRGEDPGAMVVLLRAFTHVDAFEEALTRVGLPPHVAGGGGYWSRQQVQDLISLLAAIANPLADEQLLGVLASPACGVSPGTLWLLRRAAGAGRSIWSAVLAAAEAAEPELEEPAALEAIPAEDRQRLAEVHALLVGLRDLGRRVPLESLLERAISGSGYDLAVLMADHGPQRFANVEKLMRLAREYERVEGRDLRGFLEFAAISADRDREPPAAVEAEEGEGVRIMTVHAAKGLEFPIVAVAELGRDLVRSGWGGDLTLGRATEQPLRAGLRLARIGRRPLELFDYAQLVEEAKQRDEAEELRLAYVGVTRAKERLVLSGVRKTTAHKDERALSVLRRLLGSLGAAQPAGDTVLRVPAAERVGAPAPAPDVEIPVRVSSPAPEEGARLSERLPPLAAPAPMAPGPPPLVPQLESPGPLPSLSYAALQEHARCGYRFYVERVLGLAEPSIGSDPGPAGAGHRDRAMRIGNAVHELLRGSAEQRWAIPGEAAVAAALSRQQLDPADAALAGRVGGMVAAWVESPLCAELRGQRARLRAEHPFLVELAGATVRGTIDLLVERPGRPPLLIDYKTDRLNGTSPGEAAERYAIQRSLYAVAAAEGLGAERVDVAYVFLNRPADPVRRTLGHGDLRELRAQLEARIGEIADGAFPVTAEPDWPLCRDCPARARLCPSPASPPA